MLKYILSVFASDSAASFARWATLFTVATGCWSVVYIVLKTLHLPDGSQLIGLAAYMPSPYAVNKVASAFYKPPTDSTT